MAVKSETVFGLSFGSSSSAVVACRNGRTEVLANEFGERATPALVTYLENEKLVGHAAKQALHRNARNTATLMSLFVGQRLEDVEEIARDLPCRVVSSDGCLGYQFSHGPKKVTVPVQDPLTEVLRKLLETAKSFDSSTPVRVVATTPAHFSESQKKIFSDCVELAGFGVLRVVSEPAATCLAYGIGQNDRKYSGCALVYNLGQWTLTVSLVQVRGGMYRIVTTKTLTTLGGRLFDAAIIELLVSEFKRQWKVDVSQNERALYKLRVAAEAAKHTLSSNQTASVHIESLHEGIDFQYTLTRGRFEGICGILFKSSLEPISAVLEEAGISKDELGHVILAGGSCKIPRLQQLLREEFPSSSLLHSLPPDEVITTGAALQAGILAGRSRGGDRTLPPDNVIPCTATDLWVACTDSEECLQLLPRHTPIPCQRTASLVVKPSGPSQEKVSLEVKEGSKTSDKVVAKFLIPASAEDTTVDLTIQWMVDNTVSLQAKETVSGWSCSMNLEPQLDE